MTDRTTAEWALLRVAVAVFDVYAHGSKLPTLAQETAHVIEGVRRHFIAANPAQRMAAFSLLLDRAASELRNMANDDTRTIQNADKIRDYFAAFTEGKLTL